MSGKNADKKESVKTRKVTQAPEPITPLCTLGCIGISDTEKPEPITPAFWTITIDELMLNWNIDSSIITSRLSG